MKCVAYLHISSYRSVTWAHTNTVKHSMEKIIKYDFAFCAETDVWEKRISEAV
jgi:hypothetical protein